MNDRGEVRVLESVRIAFMTAETLGLGDESRWVQSSLRGAPGGSLGFVRDATVSPMFVFDRCLARYATRWDESERQVGDCGWQRSVHHVVVPARIRWVGDGGIPQDAVCFGSYV